MSFTPTIVSGRPSDGSRCTAGAGWIAGAVALLVAGTLFGCKVPAEVHPDYANRAPERIRVPPTVNRTIHQLDAVTFGGMLQRAIIGGDTYNVPELLSGSVEEVLLLRGYSVDETSGHPISDELNFRLPLPEGADTPEFDGVCYSEIRTWQSRRTSTSGLRMEYRIELYRVPTGERLFAGDFVVEGKGWDAEPEHENVAKLIRISVRGALSSLPRAPEK